MQGHSQVSTVFSKGFYNSIQCETVHIKWNYQEVCRQWMDISLLWPKCHGHPFLVKSGNTQKSAHPPPPPPLADLQGAPPMGTLSQDSYCTDMRAISEILPEWHQNLVSLHVPVTSEVLYLDCTRCQRH